jgi:hypothetical protein
VVGEAVIADDVADAAEGVAGVTKILVAHIRGRIWTRRIDRAYELRLPKLH